MADPNIIETQVERGQVRRDRQSGEVVVGLTSTTQDQKLVDTDYVQRYTVRLPSTNVSAAGENLETQARNTVGYGSPTFNTAKNEYYEKEKQRLRDKYDDDDEKQELANAMATLDDKWKEGGKMEEAIVAAEVDRLKQFNTRDEVALEVWKNEFGGKPGQSFDSLDADTQAAIKKRTYEKMAADGELGIFKKTGSNMPSTVVVPGVNTIVGQRAALANREEGLPRWNAQLTLENKISLRQAHKNLAKRNLNGKTEGFSLVTSSGIWSTQNVLNEQVWLLKNWFPKWCSNRVGNPKLLLPTKGMGDSKYVFYMYGAEKKDTQLFNSNLLAKFIQDAYVFLPPSLHALLIPKIEIWVEYSDAKPKLLRFDEHLGKEDLLRLMSGKSAEIPGVGLISVDLEDKASSAAELRKNYVLNLKVYSTNIQDFVEDSGASSRATFRDLWYNVDSRVDSKGKPNNVLRINLGWQVPPLVAVMEATNMPKDRCISFVESFKKNNLSYRLFLHKYNLDFKQNGAIEFTGTYQAATVSNLFNSDVFPIPRGSKQTINYRAERGESPLKLTVTEAISQIEVLIKTKDQFTEELQRASALGGEEGEETRQNISSQLKDVNQKLEGLRKELKGIRFSGLMDKLLDGEKVFGINVSLEGGKLTEMKEGGASDTDKSGTKLGDAAREALKSTRSVSGSHSYHAANFHLVARQPNSHNIVYTKFGAILETMIDNIMTSDAGKQMNKDLRFHLGKAEIRFDNNRLLWCNIGEIPITIAKLSSFMQLIYSSIPADETPFPFSRFLEMLMNDLLLSTFNNSQFFLPPSSKRTGVNWSTSRHVSAIKYFSSSKKFIDDYSSSDYLKQFMEDGVQKNVIKLGGSDKQNDLAAARDQSRELNKFLGYSNAIRNSYSTEQLTDIYYLYLYSVNPVYLKGKLEENLRKGIHHFFIGSESGILKEISFEQDEIQGRQEAIMLSNSRGQENIFHFDATLKLVGNSLFSNGDLIYIDPNFSRVHNTKITALGGYHVGLGGYYNVYAVNHSLSRDGFETELKAKWNSFAGENGSTIIPSETIIDAFTLPAKTT